MYDSELLGEHSFIEVWQNQQYWPINGWDGQKHMQYSSLNYDNATDQFPVIDLPPG